MAEEAPATDMESFITAPQTLLSTRHRYVVAARAGMNTEQQGTNRFIFSQELVYQGDG